MCKSCETKVEGDDGKCTRCQTQYWGDTFPSCDAPACTSKASGQDTNTFQCNCKTGWHGKRCECFKGIIGVTASSACMNCAKTENGITYAVKGGACAVITTTTTKTTTTKTTTTVTTITVTTSTITQTSTTTTDTTIKGQTTTKKPTTTTEEEDDDGSYVDAYSEKFGNPDKLSANALAERALANKAFKKAKKSKEKKKADKASAALATKMAIAAFSTCPKAETTAYYIDPSATTCATAAPATTTIVTDTDATRQRRDDNEVPVCKCDDGQYWNVTGLHCSACPADTYSDNFNTIADCSDTYDGYRLKCTPCPHLYVSAEGSSGSGSCSPAYALESRTNMFCSRSVAGDFPPKGSKDLPLRPILDKFSCKEAAKTLGLTVYSGSIDTPQCVDEKGTCDTHKNKGKDYYETLCSPSAPKIKAADGAKKRLRDACKVSCKTCLVNSKNPTKPPRGCALIGESVRLFPDDYEDSQLFWDGSDFKQVCKVAPCGKSKGFNDLLKYAPNRDSISYCEPSAGARKAEENEAYVAFYLTVCCLVLVIEILGGCYLVNKDHREAKDILFVIVVGVRSFDMMSDWAFYSISLRPEGRFDLVYEGDFEAMRDASLAFSVFGLLLWLPDIYAYMLRSQSMQQVWYGDLSNGESGFLFLTARCDRFILQQLLWVFLLCLQLYPSLEHDLCLPGCWLVVRSSTARRCADCCFLCCRGSAYVVLLWYTQSFPLLVTVFVMLLEDIPQFILTIVYLDTTGFADADHIAKFSFVMSMFSLLFNSCLLCYECKDIEDKDFISNTGGKLYTNPVYAVRQSLHSHA